MSHTYNREKLRERAEEILSSRVIERKKMTPSDVNALINDLTKHQIEVDLQNEELRNSILKEEESKNKYTNLFDFIPFGYFTLNKNGIILEVNKVAMDLLGLDKFSLINRALSRYIAPEYHNMFSSLRINALNSMTLQSYEIQFLNKSGPLFYAQLDCQAFVDSLTNEKYMYAFIRDITSRKQKENELLNNQLKISTIHRDMSMEKLASVIVHELNQPLAVAANYIHGCIQRLEKGNYNIAEVLAALKKASMQSHRIAEIILRMKNFSCKGVLQFERLSLHELIEETLVIIKYETLDFNVNIRYLPARNLPKIMADRIHIQQLILNLARNAIESMRDENVPEARLTIEPNLINPKMLEVSLVDNGPGVAEEIRSKLFNHNFTTKKYGIGLGLSICRSIVEAHGGKISVHTTASQGACFKFTLPID